VGVEARGRVRYSDELSYRNVSIKHRPYDQAGLGPEVDPVRTGQPRGGPDSRPHPRS